MVLFIFFFLQKGKRIGFILCYHCHQTVGAGRREVVLQADAVYERKVGGYYVGRLLAVEHPYQQGDDALGDDGVAVGGEAQNSVLFSAVQPYSRLAALDEVL